MYNDFHERNVKHLDEKKRREKKQLIFGNGRMAGFPFFIFPHSAIYRIQYSASRIYAKFTIFFVYIFDYHFFYFGFKFFGLRERLKIRSYQMTDEKPFPCTSPGCAMVC